MHWARVLVLAVLCSVIFSCKSSEKTEAQEHYEILTGELRRVVRAAQETIQFDRKVVTIPTLVVENSYEPNFYLPSEFCGRAARYEWSDEEVYLRRFGYTPFPETPVTSLRYLSGWLNSGNHNSWELCSEDFYYEDSDLAELDEEYIIRILPTFPDQYNDVSGMVGALEMTPDNYFGNKAERSSYYQRFVAAQFYRPGHRNTNSTPLSAMPLTRDFLEEVLGTLRSRLSPEHQAATKGVTLIAATSDSFLDLVAAPQHREISISGGLARAVFGACYNDMSYGRWLLSEINTCERRAGSRAISRPSNNSELGNYNLGICSLHDRKDPELIETAVNNAKACIFEHSAFFLSHELAHIYLDHSGGSNLGNEKMADRCAMVALSEFGWDNTQRRIPTMIFEAIESDGASLWGLEQNSIEHIAQRRVALTKSIGDEERNSCTPH